MRFWEYVKCFFVGVGDKVVVVFVWEEVAANYFVFVMWLILSHCKDIRTYPMYELYERTSVPRSTKAVVPRYGFGLALFVLLFY